MKIVIVEDNDDFANLVGFNLALGGHKVSILDNGTRAMHDYVWEGADFALVDINLPGCNGRKVLAWLAATKPSVYRVAMTGLAPSAELQTLSCAVLHKPFSVEYLRNLVTTLTV